MEFNRAGAAFSIRKMVEADVYYTAGVVRRSYRPLPSLNQRKLTRYEQWDPERIVIAPFIAATTIP